MTTSLKLVQFLDLIATGKVRRMTSDEEMTYMCEGTGYWGKDDAGNEVMADVGEEDANMFDANVAITVAVSKQDGEVESSIMLAWAKS